MRGPDIKKVNAERRLRHHSTDAEMALWFELRDRRLYGFKFVRQEAIEHFIVDFVCRQQRLVIEVDGGQHADSIKDRVRDEALKAAGYRILRFWNRDILKNRSGVLQVIAEALSADAN